MAGPSPRGSGRRSCHTDPAMTIGRQAFVVNLGGKVSHDHAGAEVIRGLRHEGVSTHLAAVATSSHTSYSTILMAGSGERTVLN